MRPNHGMQNIMHRNELCNMQSYHLERVGRFGRLFHELSPLYTTPKALIDLGQLGGPMDIGNTSALTDSVPLGMIFLGQFIDHDITFDTTSNFDSINQPADIENVRTPQLDLDCIFGGGPEDEPFLYTVAGADRDLYLLTGLSNNNLQQGVDLETHDLARTGKGIAIIGDPRNDENRIISQLQLAFIRFYNAIYHDLITEQPDLDRKEAYLQARQIVTWHYQWIVINEFLPTLCGDVVVKDILGNGRRFYQPKEQAFIPVEFSVAAYRFGHSMIAQEIQLNDLEGPAGIFSAQIGRGFSRISRIDQIVDWKFFFDFNGSFQKAAQLDTKLPSDLLNLPFVNTANTADKSLATRNLRRGQSFLLPSGENVARHMGREEAEITNVRNLIENIASGNNLDLSAGTPLWFYILAEAEVIGRIGTLGNDPGEGLGPVGARIVAEVLIGLLEMDSNSYLGSNRDWSPSLVSASASFTMKDLLEKAQTGINL